MPAGSGIRCCNVALTFLSLVGRSHDKWGDLAQQPLQGPVVTDPAWIVWYGDKPCEEGIRSRELGSLRSRNCPKGKSYDAGGPGLFMCKQNFSTWPSSKAVAFRRWYIVCKKLIVLIIWVMNRYSCQPDAMWYIVGIASRGIPVIEPSSKVIIGLYGCLPRIPCDFCICQRLGALELSCLTRICVENPLYDGERCICILLCARCYVQVSRIRTIGPGVLCQLYNDQYIYILKWYGGLEYNCI